MCPKIELTIAAPDSGRRLDALLAGICPGFSRSLLAKSIKAGLASLDGQSAKPSTLVRTGQRLIFRPIEQEDTELLPVPGLDLDVLYQDGDIFVINKHAGLTVHPGAGQAGTTLAGALLALDPGLSQVGPSGRPGLVHRLDKDTSGVMVIARNAKALEFLTMAFAGREVEKRYLAFVKGQIPDSGRIDTPIGRHPTLRHKMRASQAAGRTASTIFKVVKRFPLTGLSLVLITLLTGRTHQARVHLASIGAPVLADPVYGRAPGSLATNFPSLAPLLGRQFLHARRLAIPHPNLGSRLIFRAPWPSDFLALLRELLSLEKTSR
jgi:23S rRNA pseudouridine1911/1915/1917 synthase